MTKAALKYFACVVMVWSTSWALGGCNSGQSTPDPAKDAPTNAAQVGKDALIPIRIAGFECGDNCYLSYQVRAGTSSTPERELQRALCKVDVCEAWFEQQAIPPEVIGLTARVNLGKGKQYDSDYNIMNDNFPEIKRIVLDPVK